MKKTSRYLSAGALAVIALGVLFYVTLPALSIHSVGLWLLLAFVLMAAGLLQATKRLQKGGAKPAKGKLSTEKILLSAGGAVLLLVVGMNLVFSPIFQAKGYAGIMTVHPAPVENYQITLDEVPLMDRDTATLLANRKMGTLVELVSQFEVDEQANTQINYQGSPVRVLPLEYSGLIKWLNNKGEGIPGYIIVNMKTQETTLVNTPGGINYSPSAYFGHDLMRHVWMDNPFALYGDYSFEIDEAGKPVWIVQELTKTMGLFSGTDLKAVAVVDAVTGEISRYDVGQIPQWIDTAYSADMVITQYDWHGVYQNGFLNSLFGQKNVVETTEGYNYIAFDDDLYLYTGITSVVSDESNIGFIFTNLRTKDTVQYNYASAEEYSAMDSAMGQVQHLGYRATFPILTRVSGELTYCMAMKDGGGLVKMYAMVNAAQYQVVVTQPTLEETKTAYAAALMANGITVQPPGPDMTRGEEVTGQIAAVQSATLDGNTYLYVKLTQGETIYEISVKEHRNALFLTPGDRVTLIYRMADQSAGIVPAGLRG